jgi:hypothetical protein
MLPFFFLSFFFFFLAHTTSSLRLEATFTLFTSPVRSITLLSQPEAGRFRGCLLCIAEDGTIGLVLLDGLKL